MKVYVVMYGFDYEGYDVGGIYSTEEKALRDAKSDKYDNYDNVAVLCTDVDSETGLSRWIWSKE